MPRLTNPIYTRIHHYLRRYWVEDPQVYSLLAPSEQWDIHAFFQPYVEWRDEELVEYRKRISKERPSLPQRAGRALRRFDWAVSELARLRALEAGLTAEERKKHKAKSIHVYPLMRPEPDFQKIARALIRLAEEKVKRDAKSHPDGDGG